MYLQDGIIGTFTYLNFREMGGIQLTETEAAALGETSPSDTDKLSRFRRFVDKVSKIFYPVGAFLNGLIVLQICCF